MTTQNKGAILVGVSILAEFLTLPAFAIVRFTMLHMDTPSTILQLLIILLRMLPLLALVGFVYGIMLIRKK